MSAASSKPSEIIVEVVNGLDDGLCYRGAKDKVLIGRLTAQTRAAGTSDLLLRSRAISRPHCAVAWQEGRWVLEDLKSSNGTRSGGKILEGKSSIKELGEEDHFVLGSRVVLRFRRNPRHAPEIPVGTSPDSAAAAEILDQAKTAASRRGEAFVGAEDLLVCIVESDCPVTAEFLKNVNLAPDRIAAQLAEFDRWGGSLAWIGKALLAPTQEREREAPESLPATPRVQTLATLAEKFRIQTAAPKLDPIHWLMAILEEGGSLGVEMIARATGKSCMDLLNMANHLTRMHYQPVEPETMIIRTPARKRRERRIVDHATWLQAGEIADLLQTTQVQYQMADPAVRFDALQGALRESLAKIPRESHAALYEQLRLMFPLPESSAELALPAPPVAQPAPLPERPSRDPAPGIDEHRELAPPDPAILQAIFDVQDATVAFDPAAMETDDDFLQLVKVLYRFAVNVERLVIGMQGELKGVASGESKLFLRYKDMESLETLAENYIERGGRERVDDMYRYLNSLKYWMVALFSGYTEGVRRWNDDMWEKLNPHAIRTEAERSMKPVLPRLGQGKWAMWESLNRKLTDSMKRMGRGESEVWATFEKRVRDLDPQVAFGEFKQMVDKLAAEKFRDLQQSDKG